MYEVSAPAVERGVVEPELGGGARAHVFQHHVGLGRPIPAGAPRRLVPEVDLDEALPAVKQRVDDLGFAPGPHDLDHVRALIGEQHRGHPAGPAGAEMEHAHRCERRGPFLSGSGSRSCHALPPKAGSVGARNGRGHSGAAANPRRL